MGRVPCCDEMGLKKGPWTPEEDRILVCYIQRHGHGNWRALPKQAGLSRCGKSCRLRWTNYLRPDVKRGDLSKEEEDNIIYLHAMLGNRWSAIAAKFPGRTDNEIKNVWHTHLKKRLTPNQIFMDSKRRNRFMNSMNMETNMIAQEDRISPAYSYEIVAEDRSNVGGERSLVNSLEELLEIDDLLMSGESLATKNCSSSSSEDDDSARERSPEQASVSSNEEDIRFWLNLLVEAGHLEFFNE